ncbi:MAG: sulfatase [Vicinamibacterales bacterium]|jgi:arylsulfatase A-like enzyme|nr:sulfatase [Vicinamibacterales bacterium]
MNMKPGRESAAPHRHLTLAVSAVVALAVVATACGGLPPDGEDEPERPNILWIIAEDLGPELGVYGHPAVETPNLDRLAADGVRYTRAFTTAPVCSTSRSAFMTGMYQTTIGAHNHRSHRDDGYTLPAGVRVITDWLREAGYLTANLVDLAGDANETYFRGTGKTDWNFQYDGEPFDTDRWSDLAGAEPFYAQVNFPETHRGAEWDGAHEQITRPADPDAVWMPPYYPDHPEARADWAQYLNAVMSLDRKVGFVLDTLERDGLADRTLVVFMGDHGRAMVRGKQWPYDSGLHVPLIVRWPAAIPAPAGFEPGRVDDQLIAAIDLTATTLAIAGAGPPDGMQGRVFLGAQAGAPREYLFGGRDRGDETVDRIRTVRDVRYRYLRNYFPDRGLLQTNRYKEFTYPMIPLMRELDAEGQLTPLQARLLAPTRSAEELYDLEADPYETVNLAADPAHADVRARLRAALEGWIDESNDQGRVPEAPEIHEYWERQMQQNYDARIDAMLEARRQRR